MKPKGPTLDELAEGLAHMGTSERIIAWDRRQVREVWDPKRRVMVPNPAARRCQQVPAHGLLQINRTGDALVCCAVHPINCDYAEPVSR